MELGVALGWINISLLAMVGIFANFRWKHLGFFPVYALSLSLLGLLGLVFIYNREFALIRSNIGNLLCLLAIAEVWRIEIKGRQWWFGLALIPMVVIPFLPLEYTLAYQLPQASLTIVFVLLFPIALKRGNALLTGWGINGLAVIIGDIASYLLPASSWNVIRLIYPAAFLAMNGVWLWKLLEPERARLAEFLASLLRLSPELATQVAGGGKAAPLNDEDFAVAAEMGLTEGAEIYRFPAGRNESRDFGRLDSPEVGSTLDEINERLESIETAMDTVVKLALERDKIFLSRSELAVYLGVKEPVADKFVSYHDIRKIPLTGDAEDWIVFTRDVNEAIGIAD